jgi:hypothetical protein
LAIHSNLLCRHSNNISSSFFTFCLVAAAILGGYSSLIGIAVLRSKMKSTPAPVVEAVKISETPTTTDASGIPSVDSPEFDAYVDSKAFMMLLENDSQLTELTNSM